MDKPEPESVWRHAKGGTYTVLGVAQARGTKDHPDGLDLLTAADGTELVVYYGESGQLHVRTLADFMTPGKFTPQPTETR